MEIGNKMLELRKKANLSQEQLAEKMNVTRQTISKWELNETAPDIRQAKELSKIFKTSLDELTDNDINEFSNALNNNTNLDLSPSLDDKVEEVGKTNNISSFSEQKQQLENLKNELLEESQIIQEPHIENGPTLKKKRK